MIAAIEMRLPPKRRARKSWHNCQPLDLHRLARQWFVGAKPIELQKLAVELGVSRATAYRWAGSAEQLISEVLASLTEDSFKHILHATDSSGSERVLDVLERVMRVAHQFRPLRHFLANNTQLGLKIVASRRSPVRERLIANLQQLLEQEVAKGTLSLPREPAAMAYGLTRVMESFLYIDLINDTQPDFAIARDTLQCMLSA